MAILSREEFFSRLNERIAGDSTDEGIAFLEDMTDTYNDMEVRANGNGEDWEKKYKELDESWRKRYSHRFFNGDVKGVPNENGGKDDVGYDPDDVSLEDLFE